MPNKASRQEVFAAINSERDYQDWKWTPEVTANDGQHSFEEWLMYILDYADEARHILSRKTKKEIDETVPDIMRKIGALAVAAMEQHGAPLRQWPELHR